MVYCVIKLDRTEILLSPGRDSAIVLAAYLRYKNPPLTRAPKRISTISKRRQIAEALGAEEVPKSIVDGTDYLQPIRAERRFDQRTAEVTRCLFCHYGPLSMLNDVAGMAYYVEADIRYSLPFTAVSVEFLKLVLWENENLKRRY